MVTTVYLVRHGHAMGNLQKVFQGTLDLDLSPIGYRHLEVLKNYFSQNPVDCVYSSELIRAKKTANAIAEKLGIQSQQVKDLCEINCGKMEGSKIEDFPTLFPKEYDLWEKTPQDFEAVEGETMKQVYERMKNCVNKIASENEGKSMAIVSHGCSIRNYIAYALGRSIDFLGLAPWLTHGNIIKMEFENGEPVSVKFLNIQES